MSLQTSWKWRSRRHIQFRASLFLVGKVFAFGRRAFLLLSRFHSFCRTFLWKVRQYTLSRDWGTNTRWPEAKTMSVQCLAGAKLDMPASSSFCWQLLTFADSCWHLLTVADICWQLLTRKNFSGTKSTRVLIIADICWHLLTLADICWHLLTFADICWHLLTFADICWHLLTFADVCWTLPAQTIQQFSWNALITPAGHWLARTSLGYRI